MKKIMILGVTVLLFVSASLLNIATYTEQQTQTIAHEISGAIVWNDFKPISFGDLLYSHLHAMADTGTYGVQAGWGTPGYYKDGVRLAIATNPQMVSAAMDAFGESIIQQINLDVMKEKDKKLIALQNPHTRLVNPTPEQAAKWAQDSIARVTKLQEFTTSKYWDGQKITIAQYDKMIEKLLALSDSELGQYIEEIGQEQASPVNNSNPQAVKTAKWLYDNGLIKKLPKNNYDPYGKNGGQVWYLMKYPVDLLLFTYRINKDYPKWTHRRILLQAQDFSKKVKELI